MVFESELANALLVTVGTGTVISGLSTLAEEKVAWNWKKFLYTLGIASISGLGIIEASGGAVTEATVIPTVVSIVGASFIGNKLFGIGAKLAGKKK